MLIGQLLVQLGLITQDQLDRSLELQASEGGRIGQIIASQGYCSQDQIDHAWADAEVVPALREAMNRVLGGGADSHVQPRFRMAHLAKRTLTQEDMLNGSEEVEVSLGIDGLAEMSFDGLSWMPFQFIFHSKSRTAYIDSESAQTIQDWANDRRREVVRKGALRVAA